MKGMHASPQTEFKKGSSGFNRKHSEESKKKMSLIRKGIKFPNRKRIKLTEEHKKNIGEANKGRRLTEEQKINLKKAENSGRFKKGDNIKIGENNPNWQGGKSFEPYDKSFNNKFKRAIRKRDNQICMLCGVHREKLKRALDVHHIDYNKLLSIPQNCISLCRNCHIKTNSNRKYWTKFFQSLLNEKYGYQYSENKEIIWRLENARAC